MDGVRGGRYWLVGAALPCLLVSLAGSLLVDRAVLVTMAVVGAICGALLAVVRRDWLAEPGIPPEPARPWRPALAGAVAALCAVSMVALLGPLGMLLVLLAGVTSPWVVDAVRRGCSPRSPRNLSDHELCRAWADSSRRLRFAPPGDRLTLARSREQYLDELQRRDADAFGSWMDLGGGSADALTFYFLPQVRRPHRRAGLRSRGSAPDGG